MLKRIPAQDLRVGMHVDKLCGPSLLLALGRRSFTLRDPRNIQRIVNSGISEIWIDTEKGIDVEAEAEPVLEAVLEAGDGVGVEVEVKIDTGVTAGPPPAAAGEAPAPPAADTRPPPVVLDTTPASMAQEAARAADICVRSKSAVASMFKEVRMGNAVETEHVMPLVDEIYASITRNQYALISMARLKTGDNYTYMHSVAVSGLMVALARQLQLTPEQVRDAGLAGLLHDIGKIAIPADVINKPGKLTDQEFALIKTHPAEGHRILRGAKNIPDGVLEACLQHHEKTDGSGYPRRSTAGAIGPLSKMTAICDVYDAITSDRAYKKGWNPATAISRMTEWAPGHFDTTVFNAFVQSVGIYPVGTLVRLTSERLAIVVEQSEKSPSHPKVKVFFSTLSLVKLEPVIIDLASPGCAEKIVAPEDSSQWRFGNLLELWRDGAEDAALR